MIVISTPAGDIGSQVLSTILESAPSHGEKLRVIVRDPGQALRLGPRARRRRGRLAR